MKKIWQVFFASILLLSATSPTVVTAAENIGTTQNVVAQDDRTPIINLPSLSISKKIATADDELKLSIKIENSDYVGLVRVIYWDPGTQFFKTLYLLRNINTGMHETTIKITENTFPGEYVVREINTTDANGLITASYHYKDSTYGNPADLSAADYTVTQIIPDTTGPMIDGNSLQLSSTNGIPGTKIGFSLSAQDESGIQELIAHYLNPVTNVEEAIPFTYNETTALFEGSFDVVGDTAAGEWRLTRITAVDTLGNASEWTNSVNLAHGAFIITQPEPDIIGPVIDGSSLQLSTTEGTPGTTIGFSLGVQDESGVQEVIAHYLNPLTKEQEAIPFIYNEITSLFEGIFEVTDDTVAGEWILAKITAKDALDNVSELDNSADPTHGMFKVTQPDTSGPQIDWNSLTLSANEVTEGDKLIVSLDISDPNDIKTATLAYRVPGTNELHSLTMTKNETTGHFEAELVIAKGTTIGEWNLDSITAKDKAENTTTVYNNKFHTGTNAFDLSKGKFNVLDKKGEVTRPNLSYSTYIQSSGWQKSVAEGETSGTTGEAKRLEAIKIDLSDSGLAGTLLYRTHVENKGWLGWVEKGQMSGTKDESKRLEAIEIKLTDELAATYDIYYRVHSQNFGWLDWAKNGESVGTEGLSLRLEGIEVILVKKGGQAPGATKRPFIVNKAEVSYAAHVQNLGWQKPVSNGVLSGTTGKALRLEGIKLNIQTDALSGGIKYQAHIQKLGWQNWKENGQLSGTEGKSLRLEAIQIILTGEMAKIYDIYYRAHVQDYGWLGWAKNGQSAGTEGHAKRLEGIEVRLVLKGKPAPGSTVKPFVKK